MANSRKPNNLLKLEGTFRKDRHGDDGESLDDVDLGELPPAPDFLGDIAREEWYRVTGLLEKANLLKGTDYGIMVSYCRLFELIASGEADNKVTIYSQFRVIANDIGLTPVARSKVIVGDKKPKSGNQYSDL